MKYSRFILFFLVLCNFAYAEDKWVPVNTDDFHDSYENIIFLDSLNGYLQGFSAIYKTTDGGAKWRSIYQPVGEYTFITSFVIVSEGVGYLSTNDMKLFKTTDFGENWSQITYPSTNNIQTIFALDKDQIWLLTFGPQIFSSTDGGTNWTKSDNTFNSKLYPNNLYFLNNNKGFILFDNRQITSEGNFFQTTDGGINWNSKQLPTDSVLSSIFFINNKIGWMGGNSGTLLKTTDAGDSWQHLSFPTNDIIWGIFFLNEQEGWVAAVHWDINWMNRYGKIFYTTDGGENWVMQFSEPENSGSLEIMCINFPTPYKGWAGGNNGVLLTMDRTTSVNEEIITNIFSAKPIIATDRAIFKINTAESGYISFELFDIMGREIINFNPQYYQSGANEISFDISALSPGVYLYQFTYNSQIYTGKLLIK